MARLTARRLLEHWIAAGEYDLVAMVMVVGSLEFLSLLQEAEVEEAGTVEDRVGALSRLVVGRQAVPVLARGWCGVSAEARRAARER